MRSMHEVYHKKGHHPADLPLRDWCKKLYKPAALLKIVLSRPSA